MLKFIRGLVVIVVLLASAYAPPTYAASADIIMTQIQAGGSTAALQELIVLYNNSDDDVDITGWCLSNKTNSHFACFSPTHSDESIVLPGRSFATVASTAMQDMLTGIPFSLVYTSTNQSSGAIVGSNDTISLINKMGVVVDAQSWSTSLVGGMLFSRRIAMSQPLQYLDTDQPGDWVVQSLRFIPDDQVVRAAILTDVCVNIEGQQETIPDGLMVDSFGQCLEGTVLVDPPNTEDLLPLRITELLPNATGSDTNNEFIELYNPNDSSIDLSDYQLWYGPNLDKSVSFPVGTNIAGHSYTSFTNADMAYSLLNSSSRVQLTNKTIVIDQTPLYQDPGEDIAWALIDGQWQYTNQPTPGAPNVSSLDEDPVIEVASIQKPCATNQYRSPDTNRCRLIAASVGTVTPCKDDQYRSEETNRCRNITSDTATPAACKEGQERNPDTNRCRNIVSGGTADYAVLGTQTSKSSNAGYVWLAVGIVVLLALAYGVWEWRYELRKLAVKLAMLVRIRK